MTVLKRVLGTTIAAGALLLTVGALPASAQTVAPAQAAAARPAVTGQAVFTGISFSSNPVVANIGAYNSAFVRGEAAGYTAAQCKLTRVPIAFRINLSLYESTAQVTCNA
ncbi:hypothetical protein [Kitasatospora viridis]|uniref:Uncharacterized protein n=1 Tax=Kitasatospora viridis TaxID=281105 RepID=A0A561TTC2_9ACTN|nr:hypothetical protein [Kitasatospora viridis]TWF90350.1 hypothetical protein FHX73_13394 [Kitasatospora viridis]